MNTPRTFERRLSARGLLTIPAPIRRALELSPGDTLAFIIDDEGDEGIRIVKLTDPDSTEELASDK